MKKLLGISLVAIMSVSAANAEIASKAYVNAEDTKITDTIGTLSSLTTTAKTNLVAAINEVGGDVSTNLGKIGKLEESMFAVENDVDKLNGNASVTDSVANKIATALSEYTKTGADTTYAKQSDFTTLQNAVNNQTTGLAATKAIADANATAITAIEGSAYATSGITSAKVSDYDAAVSAVNNQTTGLAATNTLAVAALPKTEAASTYQTLANISTNMTTDTGSDTKYPSVKAVETAIGTVNSAASGLDTRLTTAEGKITAIEGSAYATSGITSAKVSDYDAAVSAVNNASTGLAATKTIADANATAITTLNGDASTTGSVDNKIAAAQSTLQSAINAKADAATTLAGYGITDGVQSNNAITASSKPSIVQYDAKGLVTAGWEAGGLAVKDKIINNDVASNAGIEMSKIAMPTTIADGSDVAWGTYSLTADVGQNGITYKWELIERASPQQGNN